MQIVGVDSLLHGGFVFALTHEQKPPLGEAGRNHGKNINEAQKALFFAKSPRADDLLLGVLCGCLLYTSDAADEVDVV